eukprot:m.9662 g.9662  ORF g.9662 m.9662 type:complete len:121 (-) comp5480_c0_seq1:1347-1709(-)
MVIGALAGVLADGGCGDRDVGICLEGEVDGVSLQKLLAEALGVVGANDVVVGGNQTKDDQTEALAWRCCEEAVHLVCLVLVDVGGVSNADPHDVAYPHDQAAQMHQGVHDAVLHLHVVES